MSTKLLKEGPPKSDVIPLSLCMVGAFLNERTGEITFPQEVMHSVQSLERTVKDMQKVFFNTSVLRDPSHLHRIVHKIYRYVGDTEDMVRAGLKYDITVILPGDWSGQLPTTTGHYHLPLTQGKMASPDFYQLLYGEGLALLQKEAEGVTEVNVLRPNVGDWMLFPPQYAHSTINIGNTPAVFANICVRQPHLNYEPILSRKGMAYYVLRDESEGYKLEKNSNYEGKVEHHEATCSILLPMLSDAPLGTSFWELITTRLDDLIFLTNPDLFPNIYKPDPIQPLRS